MKVVRGISLLLAGLIMVALVAAAFMPETLRIERSIVINKPPDEVFDHVADFNNWMAWNPWSERDPQAVNTISTPSRGKGAQWSWEGEEIGKGKLVQDEIRADKMIRFNIALEEPTKSVGTDLWHFDSVSVNTTKVTWIDEMELEYPIGRLSAIFMQPVMEEQFDRGLQNLKRVVEKEPEEQPAPAPMPDSTITPVSGT